MLPREDDTQNDQDGVHLEVTKTDALKKNTVLLSNQQFLFGTYGSPFGRTTRYVSAISKVFAQFRWAASNQK